MRSRWPILAIFVLSGAAGLIYEIVWSRQLVLVFGNTTQAVSAILAGFFGGMAIGSAFGGRLADRVRSPLRLYGLIELVLVVVVIATPFTFRAHPSVLRRDRGGARGRPAAPGTHPPWSGTPRVGSGDHPHGRDSADADPASQRECASQSIVRTALRREHDRRDHRHAGGRACPDRGVRTDRRAFRGRGLLGDRRGRRPGHRPAIHRDARDDPRSAPVDSGVQRDPSRRPRGTGPSP